MADICDTCAFEDACQAHTFIQQEGIFVLIVSLWERRC